MNHGRHHGYGSCSQGTNGVKIINRIACIFKSVNEHMTHHRGGTMIESHRGKFRKRAANHVLLQQGGQLLTRLQHGKSGSVA